MNKQLCGSCLVMIVAAGMGYWVWSDATSSVRPVRESGLFIGTLTKVASESPALERYTSGEVVEVIDLSRTFEPTGDELALRILLDGMDMVEQLPLPRCMEPEPLPAPRVVARRELKDAAEEASSPPINLEQVGNQVTKYLAWRLAEIVYAVQPLKGAIDSTEP